ncbi:MAG TPA: AMP-binding protein [Bacteroidales bacterium]|nr:AMP-binding protein [Bacteroidales bacterium]
MVKDTDLTFQSLVRNSAEKYGDKHALSFIDEDTYSFNDILSNVESLIAYLEKLGIEKGDRVAVLGPNSPQWVLAYLAITSMGSTVVPILHDFSADEVYSILEHSEAKALFVTEKTDFSFGSYPGSLEHVISLEDFSLLRTADNEIKYSAGLKPAKKYDVKEDDLAAIIYTSGTTGNSKGVMLTHKNIISNAYMGKTFRHVSERDRFLSVLPLAHTFENTIGLVIPLVSGSSVYYLRKPPTASVLLPALKKIRPTMMLVVPLIIEKIFYSKIKPALTKSSFMKFLYGLRPFRVLLHRAAGKKLMDTFGGKMEFFGIGGAKLNPEVDRFLNEGRFPYAVGYGLTETSPLLAGMVHPTCKVESTGAPVEGVEIKLHNADPATGEGEIWARGDNIMKGYYKNPEKTAEVLTKDGWFRTGDLGKFDRSGYLFIRGRLKTVIVGSSGENIYPEEIESVINTFKHVVESLVVEKGDKLVAMVHINRDEIEEQYRHMKDEMSRVVEKKIEEIITELNHQVNQRLNRFSRINQFVLQPVPFQKTPTKKIKRYLYY